jgi:E3 ubiquitin-protein ligase UBR4
VKNINIYFSPKPVGDVNTLAEIHYEPFWQLIGTISLSKGASIASYKLKTPVVAANLKFEYVEFYEKVTGQKTASGAVVLHCPRCTRIVNNAHGGVCGHCGEVAFQCRKCRHINYDQLDAFLCVECGYCSSGTFTWELNAGVASCAVAIENEDDYERSVRMLQANNRKVSEIRENLKLVKDQIEKKCSSASLEMMKINRSHSAPMTSALSNKLPRFVGTMQSNKTKSQDNEHSFDPSVNSRTQSLLNLARSLRGDGGSDIRSTLGDLILQHTRMRGNLPFDDDDVMVDEANSLPFGVSDPLTRLVARLEGRSQGNTSVTSRSNIDLTAQREKGAKGKKSDIVQNLTDEAKRLYTQMRIMERGSDELESRIIAWKRLNRDDIAPRGYISHSIEYNPSTCSNCSPSLTFHLLEIVHTLLKSDTRSAHCILDARFIRCLFDEQEVETPNLTLLKRSVLVTIAKNSEEGSLLILDELRCRLAGARDTGSAEILGTLLESQVKNEDKFADLALQTLSS